MSVIRAVTRMCAVGALRGSTWAEERVFDTDNTPLVDALLGGAQKAHITVFTDTDVRTGMAGMDVYATNRALSLVIEYGVASAVQVENGGVILNIPQTDQALEVVVDILETQVLAALIGNPSSRWGEVLKHLLVSVSRAPSIRGGAAKEGTRWAARQLTLVCQTIGDPPPGVVPHSAHPIREFIALARDPAQAALGMAEAANLIEAAIETVSAPDWRQAQAWLGLSERGIHGTAIAPLPVGDEEAPLLTEVAHADEDLTQPVEPGLGWPYAEPPPLPEE